MPREVTFPAITIYEAIQSLQEFPEAKIVRVIVGATDSEGVFVVSQQYRTYIIDGSNYVELLSPNPLWNPAKPGGTYFNDDLWHFIDQQNG